MIFKDTINILKPVQTKDNQGRVNITYPIDHSTPADFQPLKYSVMYKPYGITDKTSNVVFCKDKTITADCRIGFNGKQYIIDSILPYRNHVEVYIELVV